VAGAKIDLTLQRSHAINTGMEALQSLAQALPAQAIARLVGKAKLPFSFLVELLTEAAPQALEQSSAIDRAALRGLRLRQELLGQEGGLVSASLLGTVFAPAITRQAVDDRRKKGQLIALQDGSGHFKYPVWQVHAGAALPVLGDVLRELDVADPMAAVVFFLQRDPRLKGKRPLDAARDGKQELLLELARTFGEHGAL
jgi:hypothetical protein